MAIVTKEVKRHQVMDEDYDFTVWEETQLVVYDDETGVEYSRKGINRRAIEADADTTNETAAVKTMCEHFHTDDVKNKLKAKKEAQKAKEEKLLKAKKVLQ